jgi:hypothetical protein
MGRYRFLGYSFYPFLFHMFLLLLIIADNQPGASPLHVHNRIICTLSGVYPKGYGLLL